MDLEVNYLPLCQYKLIFLPLSIDSILALDLEREVDQYSLSNLVITFFYSSYAVNSSFLFFSQVNIEPLLSSSSFLFVNHPFMMKFRMTLASPALLNPHICHKFVIILCPTDFFATQLIVEYCTISKFVTAVVLCFFWEAIIDWHFLFLSTCIIHLLLLFVVVFNKSTKSNFFPTTYLPPTKRFLKYFFIRKSLELIIIIVVCLCYNWSVEWREKYLSGSSPRGSSSSMNWNNI